MKPDRATAMRQIIAQVKTEFPLYEPATFICGANTDCAGCPKKLLEMVDGEIDLPAGRSPVVLVFDDASPSHFRYIERNGALEILFHDLGIAQVEVWNGVPGRLGCRLLICL